MNAIRLRAERSTTGDTSTVATAAIAAPTAANSPKWCTHLVGVNIRKNIVPKMMPISRHTGPRATPGIRLRRNMMNIDGEQAQRGDQEAEPARQRAVDGRQDQVVVAQVLGVPRLARPDRGANPGGLQHRCQRLVGEHDGQDHGARGQQWQQQRPGPDDAAPLHQDAQQRPAAGQQRGDGDQAGRLDAEGERRGDDRQRGRGEPCRR